MKNEANIKMISEENGEIEKEVEIYTNGPFVFLCVNNLCFTPFDKRENCVIPSGYEQVEVKNVSIFRLKSKIVVITTEYFDLSIDGEKFFLHMDDRAHSIYTFSITFRIPPDVFAEIVGYTFAHAEKIVWSGEY